MEIYLRKQTAHLHINLGRYPLHALSVSLNSEIPESDSVENTVNILAGITEFFIPRYDRTSFHPIPVQRSNSRGVNRGIRKQSACPGFREKRFSIYLVT